MRKLILFLLIGICQMADAQSVTVMSYNIRFDNPGDGENAWPNRIQKVAHVIQKYDPDLIGIQEALHHQLEDLIRVLPDYTYVGVGRDDGKQLGEYSAILFKNNRFGLLSKETRWLSETPEMPGSIGWDAAITRLVTIARFYDKQLKREFALFNTHFDHVGKEARKMSALQLMEWVDETRQRSQNLPVLLTGDFNCERTEEPYEALVKDNLLIDTKPANDNTGTYCNFAVSSMECRPIDFIFHTKEWILRNYKVAQDNDGKHYPSDHLPVVAAFELSMER
jgi:endonuclease/exonuclease/phosphatase family metal-dependent hydrolase